MEYTLPPGSQFNEFFGNLTGKRYKEWQEGMPLPEWITIADIEKVKRNDKREGNGESL